MNKKITTNQDLENFLKNGSDNSEVSPWSNLDQNEKRTGVSGFGIVCNEFEKVILKEAAKRESTSLANFIRQTALKHAKSVLKLD